MSSSDFNKVLIRDERLDCQDSIPFGVYRSGANVTVATFNAISESPSSVVFNVQVPSETTVLDRRVIWESTLEFDVTFTSGATSAGVPVAEYGLKQAFCPWPLHSLCNTQQATINNNSVTLNTADILPALSRLHDMRELQRYNGMTPLKVDSYMEYADGVGAIANVLGSAFNIAMEGDYAPRGALSCNISYNGNNVTAQGAVNVINTATSYHVKATFREPLLLSPFIYARPFYNGQGFYGLQNLNMVFNLNAGQNGLWRVADNAAYGALSLYSLTPFAPPAIQTQIPPVLSNFTCRNNRLIFNFLTPKPSDLLAARNVVPYWEMPRYLRTQAVQFPAYTSNVISGVVDPAAFPEIKVSSQSLQLNQVPDKLIVFFRPTNPTAFDTNRSLIVKGISINWNNQSGILASATQDQLWRYSVESGSIQSWEEFSGVLSSSVANVGQAATAGVGGNFYNNQLPSVGSYLMLDYARHINISEDYYAPGSLGNFNLQFDITVASNDRSATGTGQMDMVIITVNSGLFVTEKGQSATYTGILTKDDVLSAAAMKPQSDAEARRLVGGLDLGRILSTAGKIGSKITQYAPLASAAANLLPEGRLKDMAQKGIGMASKGAEFASKLGSGKMQGRGRGSQVFRIEDRLV